MGLGRFGQARYKPAGKWVQATPLLEVAGIAYRKDSVIAFGNAVRKAERQGRVYGLRLEREVDNDHDPMAIAVYGVARYRSWFRTKDFAEHIGYVPAKVAADVSQSLCFQGIPIAAELYSIFHGDGDDGGYWDIKFFVLAPLGNSASKRARSASAP